MKTRIKPTHWINVFLNVCIHLLKEHSHNSKVLQDHIFMLLTDMMNHKDDFFFFGKICGSTAMSFKIEEASEFLQF